MSDMNRNISDLLAYAKLHLGMNEADGVYLANRILEKLGVDSFEPCAADEGTIAAMECPDEVLAPILAYAKEKGIVGEGEEEFFTSDLLDLLSPRPSEVTAAFEKAYAENPEKAFDGLYDLGVKNDYVKFSAIARNKCWIAESTRNKIEITINLSKPEKNNKLTAKLRNVSAGYPKCMLCRENVGYVGQGRTRRNMRTIPLTLAGEEWFWQYSPYAYFYQHGIAINAKHTPMVLDGKTFEKLLDFVDYAPQYFIGSNAPLPIVGGSILAHEHFQGGKHVFPMFTVPTMKALVSPEPGVKASLPDWYNSVILLESADKVALVTAAGKILDAWRGYSDESVGIIAETTAPHNTLAPIACKTSGGYQLYLLLRNNRCDEENPDGIFHAHKEYHNIKSESIGLIEAMGRFILPGRLDYQLKEVEKFLTGENTVLAENMSIHKDMVASLLSEYGNKLSADEAREAVRGRVESVCEHILENTAVFKHDAEGMAAFGRFLGVCGYSMK